MDPVLSKINSVDFAAVAEYLERGEYTPNLMNGDTAYAYLENTATDDEIRVETLRCGIVYCIGAKLDLLDLQLLAGKKLRALGPHLRSSIDEILGVVNLIFEHGDAEGDDKIREWIIAQLAQRFSEFMRAETEKFLELLEGQKLLAEGVFGLLSGLRATEEEREGNEETPQKFEELLDGQRLLGERASGLFSNRKVKEEEDKQEIKVALEEDVEHQDGYLENHGLPWE